MSVRRVIGVMMVRPKRRNLLLDMNPDINIHDPIFTAWVEAPTHRDWSYAYIEKWRLFLGQKRTKDETLNFARSLAKEYNFDVFFSFP